MTEQGPGAATPEFTTEQLLTALGKQVVVIRKAVQLVQFLLLVITIAVVLFLAGVITIEFRPTT